ncbi:MAG TPA: alpha/beta fold hydrolase [Paraburkholderia sp.]|jgi:pimeloyl-ACP methyl ester carboxylesterase|nr:alpha/beta fold hydrolase [Paraburkholderia sp.]
MKTLSTMKPVTFSGAFGWLHRPTGPASDMGVVLCSPFGYEALSVHRGWRELAETLAARGMPTVRFDYPGTGDASGNEADPGRLRAWIDSVKAAAHWLRAETGVTQLTLCGIRLGATLAALAAEELGEIENLVLLAPVIVGKSYIRELSLHHQSWLGAQIGLEAACNSETGAVGAHGFHLYPDTLEALTNTDLEQRSQRPAPRVLIHDLGEGPRVKRLAAHYQALGAQTELQFFASYGKFLKDPRYSVPPRNAFDGVLAWLGANAMSTTEPAARVLGAAPHARIEFAGGRERPVVFGNGRYAGIFCQPARPLEDAPAVLFVNTGGVHRIGDGRIAVTMARRLAAQGIASLRMDLGGLGDSVRRDDALTLDAIYGRHAVGDATAGIDWLAEAGHPKTVMFGVCTGAYVGLHAALAHSGVVACASVNLPFFMWGGASTRPGGRHVASSGVYRLSMRNPRKWLRLLTGRANGAAITTELVRRLYARISVRASMLFENLLGQPTPGGAIRRLMLELERKGVQTSLMYGPFDEGLDNLEIHFGPNGNQLAKMKNVGVKIVPNVDHALFLHAARDAMMAQFEQFLRERVLITRREPAAAKAGLRVVEAQRP